MAFSPTEAGGEASMKHEGVIIKVLDPHHLDESEKLALNMFGNRMHREQWPEDPPLGPEGTLARWRFVPKHYDIHQWAAWTVGDTQVVARAAICIDRSGDNRHMADFEIAVVPEMRRRGIAKRLLGPIAEVARKENRQLLLVTTDSDIPAGRRFAKRLRAREGLVSQTNQLDIDDLAWDVVSKWLQRGRKQAGEFEIGLWEGPYPPEHAESMVAMKEIINTAPTDLLEFEEFKWTVEQLRQEELALAQEGVERWTIYVRHLGTGDFAGFTEVFWKPHHPESMEQGYTVVATGYRNRGLAQWLKAEMLQRVTETRPMIKRIRTGNADSNAPMIRINRKLGFKLCKSWTTWQLELDQILAYLEASREIHSSLTS
jgi:mycothiol synthase